MTDVTPSLRVGASRGALTRFVQGYGQELVILGCLVALFIVVGFINPRFLIANNLVSIFSSNAYVAVAAIGMSLVIISGQIDVSIGSLIGVLATIAGTLATKGYPVWIAWLLPILIGIAINAFIGVLVAYANIPSIVVTLGMLSVLRGGLIMATGGRQINSLPEAFFLPQGELLGVPIPICFVIVLTIGMAIWMNYSGFARAVYAIGGSAEAARTAGIAIKPMTVAVFAIHGLFAGLATVLFATQFQIIAATVPPNLELTVITAAVIGGVSILGGTGTVIGSTLATYLFASISSAMVFINVSPYWLRAVIGCLILITVLADMVRRQRVV